MFLHKKALYNLIQLDLIPVPPDLELEKWQKENYRLLSVTDLFDSLRECGIPLNFDQFYQQASTYDTPEEFSDVLTAPLKEEEGDRAFLILFELWRRTFPEKQSLSIFCDELDYQITHAENGEGAPSAALQDVITNLQLILNKHVDAGVKPADALELVQCFCAHRLAPFITQFILERIDEGSVGYAKELLEGFHRYLPDKEFVRYLNIRYLIEEQDDEGYAELEKFLEKLNKKTSLELYFDLLIFLAPSWHHHLFVYTAIKTFPILKSERDFQDIAVLISQHFQMIERSNLAEAVEKISHENPPSLEPYHPEKDPRIQELILLLKNA